MTTLGFLTVDQAAPACSPMAAGAGRAGAVFSLVDGWETAVHFGDPGEERRRMLETVAFVDRTALRKWELHEPSDSTMGMATRQPDGGWRCPVTPDRALYLDGAGATPAGARKSSPARMLAGPEEALDLTCAYAALSLVGPGARELLARFSALDVRERSLPVGGFRPGSIARTPGYLLCAADDELLLLVGWALGEYLYDVVADAAGALGGGPAGIDAYREHGNA
jgi:glycine cleavage system aminomethyltransferase T